MPGAVLATLAACVAVHLARSFLGENADIDVLLRFAFIPARYDEASPYASDMLGGEWAKLWTFVSYALLHGSWTHLIVNAVWMLAFGSALAWRFGALRFLLFSAATAAAGAALHLALHFGEPGPLVGASAAISGHMAGAMRFMFEAGGPLSAFRRSGRAAFMAPAEPLTQALRRPQILIFLAVWFGANLIFGLGAGAVGDGEAAIAWEAHIGGFLAGLLLFPLLDPVGPRDGRRGHGDDGRLPPGDEKPHDDASGAPYRP